MSMALADLGKTSQLVLKALPGPDGAGMRSSELVAAVPTVNKSSIYSARERLRTMGYCETGDDRLWRRTADGEQLATGGVIAKESGGWREYKMTMGESVVESAIPAEPAAVEPIPVEAIEAVALEVELDALRARLNPSPLPENARRVYWAVLEMLPPAVVEALRPVTERVEK